MARTIRAQSAWEINSIILQVLEGKELTTDLDLTLEEAKALRDELNTSISCYEYTEQQIKELSAQYEEYSRNKENGK